MPGTLQVTKNDYFTYIQDGDTEIVFRDKEQVWNVQLQGVEYAIHVSGPNKQPAFVGRFNCFAKKHLMTIKGGKSSDANYESGLRNRVDGESRIKFGADKFDETVRGKLNKIHTKRTASKPWEQQEKYDAYNVKRADRHGEFSAEAQARYEVNALGNKGIGDNTDLTIVLCDLLTPDDLKESFAQGVRDLRKSNPGTTGSGTTHEHQVVTFPVDCVYQHRNGDNDFTKSDSISVTFYLHSVQPKKIEVHVVHCG